MNCSLLTMLALALALSPACTSAEDYQFPNEPAWLVPVSVRDAKYLGAGHKGVFADAPIPRGTKAWVWTDRVHSLHYTDLAQYLTEHFSSQEEIQVFLRQGFVLPDQLDFFHYNPTDAGRFVNHSEEPNLGFDGTIKDIAAGEEIVMSYSFHGDPLWYQQICKQYGALTEAQVSKQSAEKKNFLRRVIRQ